MPFAISLVSLVTVTSTVDSPPSGSVSTYVHRVPGSIGQ